MPRRKKNPAAVGAEHGVTISANQDLSITTKPKRQDFIDRNDRVYTARAYVKDSPPLVYHRCTFFTWNGKCYEEMDSEILRKELYACLENSRVRVDKKWTPYKPRKRDVDEVLDAMRAILALRNSISPPAWLDLNPDVPATELICCANGLIHPFSGLLLAHTPNLFCTNSLDFNYDPMAARPSRWLTFLSDLWPYDGESISVLQEMFGYALTPATNLQKIFLLVGPPRSGKGTIARVLKALVGHANVANPGMGDLSKNFGLAPLIGKRLAIFGDARLSNRTDQSTVVERLLSISGEDDQTIDRKYQSAWTGKLDTRIVIVSNELPSLSDASGALASRLIVLEFTRSFLGVENPDLGRELLEELPGILNWSLVGLQRLRDRGSFLQPKAAEERVREMENLTSPVRAFVGDRCVVAPERSVQCGDLFQEWCDWCDTNGHKTGNAQEFSKQLRAAFPGVKTSQSRVADGKRPRFYQGIGPICTVSRGVTRVVSLFPSGEQKEIREVESGGSRDTA